MTATGHNPQIDHPDVVNAWMLTFKEDVDSLGPSAVGGAWRLRQWKRRQRRLRRPTTCQ